MNREKLLTFVKMWHEGQKRKYTDEPYFNHVLAVANAADKTGVSYGWEIGLCHDLIEDTELSLINLYCSLRDTCGYTDKACALICESVKELTDVFTHEAFPYLNRTIRKQCESLRLHTISRISQIIKSCDLIDNTSTIVQYDPTFAVKYLSEKREILKGFKRIDGAIKTQVWNTLLEAEEKLKTK